MSIVTKAKINIKEGIVELEGSENFVSKYLEYFKQEIGKTPSPSLSVPENKKQDEEKKTDSGAKKSYSPSQTFVPIPLDLSKKDNKISLRDFYKQKQTKNQGESLVIFAYYLKKFLNIPKIEAGHVLSCCKDVGIRVPKNIPQMFYDISHNQGWLNMGEGRKYVEINIAGENLVEFDLPRKKDAKSNKTTA